MTGINVKRALEAFHQSPLNLILETHGEFTCESIDAFSMSDLLYELLNLL